MLRKLGTPQVFSEILESIFGGCDLSEAGIDYDGLPFHFRVGISDGENLTGVNFDRFMYILKRIKRASSWLDETYAIYNAESKIKKDIVVQQVNCDTIKFNTNGF
jgi:hypothetical protein